jgi:quaternary ammonium compound-resistance protein SugE
MTADVSAPKDEVGKIKKGWIFLVLAGILEPIWVVSMKLSEGFTEITWAAATFIFLFGSMFFLAQALRSKISMGTAYSIWVGIGTIGALIAGMLLFGESLDIDRVVFVLLIVIGIVGVQTTSGGDRS